MPNKYDAVYQEKSSVAKRQPFLAERELAQLVPEELRAQRAVISCQELETLLNGLPWLAGAALLVLASLVLAIKQCAEHGPATRWPR